VLAVAVAVVYLGIVLAVPLLHTDDCPAVPWHKNAGDSVPSNASCPACKFLANSNSEQIPCESTPALMQSEVPPEFTRDWLIVLASPCDSSILLRGPPSTWPA